jgi:hypothetical protein
MPCSFVGRFYFLRSIRCVCLKGTPVKCKILGRIRSAIPALLPYILIDFIRSSLLYPEDEGNSFHVNLFSYLSKYAISHPVTP